MTSRILVVEDNETLAEGLQASLELDGHQVGVAHEAGSGLIAARELDPDLIVLDLMLPDGSGLQLLKTLRDEGFDMPVLILSARGQEADKVQGYRLGADAYSVKPIGVLELQAQVEALLRRAGRIGAAAGAAEREYTFGRVAVDCGTRTVRVRGEPVELAPLEFDLLVYLLRAEGEVVSRHTLLREVWGYRNPVGTRTVDTHVHNLRQKIEEDPSHPTHLLTVRKAGYRLER